MGFPRTHDCFPFSFFGAEKPILAKMRLAKLSEELKAIIRENQANHEKVNPDWLEPYLEKEKLTGLKFEGLLGTDGERTFFVKLGFHFFFTFETENV